MILHVMIVDDEEDLLDAMVPGFVEDLSRALGRDPQFAKAWEDAGGDPPDGYLPIAISAVGYQSRKLEKWTAADGPGIHLHLVCEQGGHFPHALRLLKDQLFAVVVSDLRFSDSSAGSRAGKLFVDDVQRRNPGTATILYSAYQRPDNFPETRFVRKSVGDRSSIEALKKLIVEGCTRYLIEPTITKLGRALRKRGLLYQSLEFGTVLRQIVDFADIYFGVEKTQEKSRRQPRPTLLIDGETGTGKTELAGLLHELSTRRTFPFVTATCNQLTDENFLRSILFGHVKGSFSGATGDRAGLVESAGNGILLLDDLHKLTDTASTILHSFLDDGDYCHLGQDEVRRHAQAAIIATVETPRWRDIKQQRSLAESFIHRVEQLVLRVPPLRERTEDIVMQAKSYLKEFSTSAGQEMEISQDGIEWLIEDGFAGGNSRKLRDVIRGVVFANLRVTELIGSRELAEIRENHSTEPTDSSREVVAPTARKVVTASEGAATPRERSGTETAWSLRVKAVATRALEEEWNLSPEQAQASIQELFDKSMPAIWQQISGLGPAKGDRQPIDIKLFDELLRYFVVYQAGNPAKGAKELGMKDNALREFIYSREEKRARDENPT